MGQLFKVSQTYIPLSVPVKRFWYLILKSNEHTWAGRAEKPDAPIDGELANEAGKSL